MPVRPDPAVLAGNGAVGNDGGRNGLRDGEEEVTAEHLATVEGDTAGGGIEAGHSVLGA